MDPYSFAQGVDGTLGELGAWRGGLRIRIGIRRRGYAERRRLGRRASALQQHAHARGHASRDGGGLVPSLEGIDCAAPCEAREVPRHAAEAVGRDAHPAHLVPARGVEAGGDDDELRVELRGDGHHKGLKGRRVLGVAHPLVAPWHVDCEPRAAAVADLARLARAWEEMAGELVEREVEHALRGKAATCRRGA